MYIYTYWIKCGQHFWKVWKVLKFKLFSFWVRRAHRKTDKHSRQSDTPRPGEDCGLTAQTNIFDMLPEWKPEDLDPFCISKLRREGSTRKSEWASNRGAETMHTTEGPERMWLERPIFGSRQEGTEWLQYGVCYRECWASFPVPGIK